MTSPAEAGGWANSGMSKDQEQLLVPRRMNSMTRQTKQRTCRAECACGQVWTGNGAIGGGTTHASARATDPVYEGEDHTLRVYYYAEYEYTSTLAPGTNRSAIRRMARAEKAAQARQATAEAHPNGISPARRRALEQIAEREERRAKQQEIKQQLLGDAAPTPASRQDMQARISAAAQVLGITNPSFSEQVESDKHKPMKRMGRKPGSPNKPKGKS